MQDIIAAAAAGKPLQFGDKSTEQQLKCPRCESTNTKFCYYNNYNLSQPRHFCKNCRRYWTKCGALRNIPVGGGTRKNNSSKRSSSSNSSSNNPKRLTPPSSSSDQPPPNPVSLKPEPISALYPHPIINPDDKMFEIPGNFTSLLRSNMNVQFGSMFDGFDSGSAAASAGGVPEPDSGDPNRSGSADNPNPNLNRQLGNLNLLSWAGGWPDLANYTPGSGFQ